MNLDSLGRLASLYRSWYGNRVARGFSVTLELAHRCNVRCVFCTRWDDPENLELDTIREIAADMAGLGASYVSLSGGDPLIRSDITEIVQTFVDRAVPVHINTNGVLLKQNCLVARRSNRLRPQISGLETIPVLTSGV